MSVGQFFAWTSKNGSHKNKIAQLSSDDVTFFSILVRSHILIDFSFYKAMKNLEPFEQIWCDNVLCVAIDDNLQFAHVLKNAGSFEEMILHFFYFIFLIVWYIVINFL